MLTFILVPLIFKNCQERKATLIFVLRQLWISTAMRERGLSTKTFQTELKTDSFSEILPQCATSLRVRT